jgi:hypothetical protein
MQMKLTKIQERRCPGGLVVFLFAFLAVGVFITFEVLDLDGSNFQRLLPESVIAAEPASADVEQLLPRLPSALRAHTSVSLCPELPLPLESLEVRSRSGINGLCARFNHAFPRASLHGEPSPAPLSDDPA